MAIKAVVFDIGGVLEINTPTGWQRKWEQALNLEGGQLREKLYDVWKAGSIGSITLEDVHLQTAKILGLADIQVDVMMEDIWQEYIGSPNQDLYDYFKNLRPAYQTAILSNSFVGAREREQARYGFEDICDFIIYSHEVGLAKPDPQIYALTCERLKLAPEKVLFLDDVEENIEAAEAYGMHGVLYKDTNQAISEIEAILKSPV